MLMLRSRPTSQRKILSAPTILLLFTLYLKNVFFINFHNSNRKWSSKFFVKLIYETSDIRSQIVRQPSFHQLVARNLYVIICFVEGPLLITIKEL